MRRRERGSRRTGVESPVVLRDIAIPGRVISLDARGVREGVLRAGKQVSGKKEGHKRGKTHIVRLANRQRSAIPFCVRSLRVTTSETARSGATVLLEERDVSSPSHLYCCRTRRRKTKRERRAQKVGRTPNSVQHGEVFAHL
jgi:hypothetical protein